MSLFVSISTTLSAPSRRHALSAAEQVFAIAASHCLAYAVADEGERAKLSARSLEGLTPETAANELQKEVLTCVLDLGADQATIARTHLLRGDVWLTHYLASAMFSTDFWAATLWRLVPFLNNKALQLADDRTFQQLFVQVFDKTKGCRDLQSYKALTDAAKQQKMVAEVRMQAEEKLGSLVNLRPYTFDILHEPLLSPRTGLSFPKGPRDVRIIIGGTRLGTPEHKLVVTHEMLHGPVYDAIHWQLRRTVAAHSFIYDAILQRQEPVSGYTAWPTFFEEAIVRSLSRRLLSESFSATLPLERNIDAYFDLSEDIDKPLRQHVPLLLDALSGRHSAKDG